MEGRATVNALASSNRWGKTTLLSHVHYHSAMYKIGGESRYLNDDGTVDMEKFVKLRYRTLHTAGEWEQAALTWDECHKLANENPILNSMITGRPRSKPPHIELFNGARIKFRTLGFDAQGIDGDSYYVISIDEAGWIPDLQEKLDNVIRVRVADVRGRIYIVGTFKPGTSRDFFAICARAAAAMGAGLTFDHRQADDEGGALDLDATIRSYLREYVSHMRALDRPVSRAVGESLAELGMTPDEYADVIS